MEKNSRMISRMNDLRCRFNFFCSELSCINFVVRQAKKEKKFHFYKVRHGITSVQMVKNGSFVEITYKVDLVRLGLYISL